MTSHDPATHEPQLEALLAAGADPSAAFEASALAECASCRRELEQLAALQARLDSVGLRERSDLTALAEPGEGEGQGRALAALRAEIEATAGARTGPRGELRYLWGGLIAAAALLLLWAVPLLLRGGTGDGPVLGGNLRVDHPVGAVQAYGPLTWEDERPASGSFSVRIFDLDDPSSLDPVDQSGVLRAPRWDPPEERWRGWPARIRVEVQVFGPESAREPVDGGWADARLPGAD